jgi:hypothetical protein
MSVIRSSVPENQTLCAKMPTGSLFPIILNGKNDNALRQLKTPNQFPKT